MSILTQGLDLKSHSAEVGSGTAKIRTIGRILRSESSGFTGADRHPRARRVHGQRARGDRSLQLRAMGSRELERSSALPGRRPLPRRIYAKLKAHRKSVLAHINPASSPIIFPSWPSCGGRTAKH